MRRKKDRYLHKLLESGTVEELEEALVELKGIQSLEETRLNILIGSVGFAAIGVTAFVWVDQQHQNLVERVSTLMASTLVPSQELLDLQQEVNESNWGDIGIVVAVGMAAIALYLADMSAVRRSDNDYMMAKLELKIKRLQAQSKPIDFHTLMLHMREVTTPRRKNGTNRKLQSMKRPHTSKKQQ